MSLQASFKKHILDFNFEARTSRGAFGRREIYYLFLSDSQSPTRIGIGECAPLPGLSVEAPSEFEYHIRKLCRKINSSHFDLHNEWRCFEDMLDMFCSYFLPEHLPALRFGVETALKDLSQGGNKIIFDNDFSKGLRQIPINGLIWMGSPDFMTRQVSDKIAQGFSCLKFKIGALEFEQEYHLLKELRARFSPEQLTLRLDANGAFEPDRAMNILDQLSELSVHSIEQPIAAGQHEQMAWLCKNSPIPIALDEELINKPLYEEKIELLSHLNPAFIILKPTLLGGFRACNDWIKIAENMGIGWWLTSALESDIGLNAIAQYAAEFSTDMLQGLGTGSLFLNNIGSPLEVSNGFLSYQTQKSWNNQQINAFLSEALSS